LSDFRWLVDGEGRHWLDRCQRDPISAPQLAQRLRRDLTQMQTYLVLTQLELRQRAALRFESAQEMYFTDRALQQATDSRLAAYKATRFPVNTPIVDLCCGIGGDLLALARRGPTLGLELDPVLAYLAGANLRRLRSARAWTSCTDARQLSVLPETAVHLDPDRRPDEQRTAKIDFHQPGTELIERLMDHPAGLALKLSPATLKVDDRLHGAELEWIGHRRQCQQLVAWFGPLAEVPGQRAATILQPDGTAQRLTATQVPNLPVTTAIGSFLVEPSPCVLAAGLAPVVAEQQQLMSLTAGGGYLTGDRVAASPLATAFEVLDVMPYRPKRLKAWLHQRNVGRLEIKKRGVSIDPAPLLQQLRASGTVTATLILLRQGQRVVAIVARRLPTTLDAKNSDGID
jgi:hypothetical protein